MHLKRNIFAPLATLLLLVAGFFALLNYQRIIAKFAAALTTITINNGGTSLVNGNDITSQADLSPDTGAYRWMIGVSNFAAMNMPFNAGGTQTDFSGNANTGTNNGAVTFHDGNSANCRVGSCLEFNGVDQWVNVPQAASIDFQSASSFTISYWVKTSSAQSNMFPVSRHTPGSLNGWAFIVNHTDPSYSCTVPGKINFYVAAGNNADACSNSTVNDGNWHHIVGVYNGTGNTATLYVDGVAQSDIGSRSGNTDNNGPVQIGRANEVGTFFNGFVDEVQLYGRALSAAQITQLYNDGLASLGGPTVIQSEEIAVNDVWDLDVTAIDAAGTVGVTIASSNTTTIAAAVVGLNNGTSTLDTFTDLTSQVQGLTTAQGALTWTVGGSGLARLNMPFNATATQVDYSGFGYNGTVTGATYTAVSAGTCKVGGCYTFDGSGDYIAIAQPVSTFMSTTTGSLSVWFKPTGAAPAGAIVYNGHAIVNDTAGYMGLYRTNIGGNDRLWAYNWHGTVQTVGATYTVGAWTHLVWVHSGNQLMLYKDGAFVGSTPSGPTDTLGGTLRIGQGYGASPMGQIDEVQIYNFELSPDMISQLYQDGLAGLTGPTIIPAEETVNAQVWDLDVTAFNSSGTGYPLVASGNTVTIQPYVVTAALNNGTTTLSTSDDLPSQLTGLWDAQGAYTWTRNGTPFMTMYLPFNYGTTQINYSGSGVNATSTNATYLREENGLCQVGGCLGFRSTSTVATGRTMAGIMTGTDGTISAWVKPLETAPSGANSYNGHLIVGTPGFMGLFRTNISGQDRIWALVWDGAKHEVGVPYTVGQWTHIVWVHGGGRVWIYKDGVLGGSTTAGVQTNLTGNVSISSGFSGMIDEVQTFNIALSAAQIAQLYADGAARVSGPTMIVDQETVSNEVWDLDFTPFDSLGYALSPVASANTVSIDDPTLSVGVAGGATTLGTNVDITTQVSGLGEAQGAYTWTINGNPFMTANVPFNTGSTQYNLNGGGVHGTNVNGAFAVQGLGLCQIGGCMSFNGSTAYVDLNRIASDLITPSDGTISAWIRPLGTAPSVVVLNGDAVVSDANGYFGITRAVAGGLDRIWAFNWDGNEDSVGVTYTADVWTHIAWVHTGGRLSIYKNGVLGGSVLSNNTEVLSSPVYIGSGNGQRFEGLIDEVQIYNIALSPETIAQLYTDGAAHVAGPTIVSEQETTSGETWDLAVAPFEGNGSVFAAADSVNDVTITPPVITVGLNSGDSLISTYEDITTQVSGFSDAQGAYSWSVSASPYMTLNVPFNAGATQYNYNGGAVNGTATDTAYSRQSLGLCQVGGCMSFDGTSSFINTGLVGNQVITAGAGSISVWVRPIGTAPSVAALNGDAVVSDASGYFGITRANVGGLDRIWAFNWDGNEDSVGVTYTADVWTHIAWVHTNGRLYIYKNGVLGGSVDSSDTTVLSSTVYIGSGNGQRFEGLLDEVQIYNFAISVEEIAQLYADGLANVAGPTIIPSEVTEPGQTWNLEVTPFEGNGTVFSATSSTNTVTIEVPTVTVGLNNGVLFAADADPIPAQVTGLGTPQAAYTWSVDGAGFAALNMPFNAGTTQEDYSGNGYDSTAAGNAAYTQTGCQVGGCFAFDGADDYVALPSTAPLAGASALTISLWANISDDGTFIGDHNSGNAWESVELSSGSFVLNAANNNFTNRQILPYTFPTDSDWHHVVAVWNGANMYIYLDGANVAGPLAFAATPWASPFAAYVGARRSASAAPADEEITGRIDELQIYRRALSADQIAQLYADGNSNLAGPTLISDDETVLGQVWDLSVTPFESDGTAYASVPSANTVNVLNNSAPTAPTVLFTHNSNAQLGNSNPDGIDATPVFSAIFNDPDTGNTAGEYRIQVDDNNDFSSPLWDSGSSGTAIASCAISTRCANITYGGSALSLNGTTYYWRIKFWDNWGTEGAFSATAQFVTDQPPTAPSGLFSHDSNAQTGDTNPVGILSAHPVFSAIFNDPDLADTADKYRIQVDNDNDFSSVIWDSGAAGTNMATCSRSIRCSNITYGGSALPFDGAVYYWRIKFWDAAGIESPWSEDPVSTNTFTMGIQQGGSSIQRIQQQQQQDQQNQEEEQPVLTIPSAPIAGSVEVLGPGSVRYNWIDTSNNEAGFRILNAANQVVAEVAAGETRVVEENLSPNTVVSGRRVVAFNEAGQSVPSEFIQAITAAPVARPVVLERGGDSVTFTIEPVVTAFPGQTAVRFEVIVSSGGQAGQQTTTRTLTSDWVQTGEYTFTGVAPEESVQVRVITRNQEGLAGEPSEYEDVAQLSRRFNVTIGVFEKGTNQLFRPMDPSKVLSVSMRVESVGTDPASSVILNLPLPRYITYRPNTLTMDGQPKNDAADGDGANADRNGVSASWARFNPGQSHTLTFELAFDLPDLYQLRQTSGGEAQAAANPLINLQASVTFAESDAVYMSPVITLEPDVMLVEDPEAQPEIPEEVPVVVPTPEETEIIEQILEEEFGQPSSQQPPAQPGTQPSEPPQPAPAPTLERGETSTSSDNGSFNIDVTGGNNALGLTGSAEVSADAIRFTGTTTQPFTVITLIFNDSITAIAVSDAEGFWQTFVSADRLGIQPGQEARVKIEAIAAKGELRSERVNVGEVTVSRGRSGDIQADFETVVSESAVVTAVQEIRKEVVRVVEQQEPVIQATLSVAAPVVVVSSVPLWGYLPYAPTLIYHAITYLVGLIGRKKRTGQRFYGVAYDSITKQPLALAIIRVYKVEPVLSGAANVGAAAATNKKLVTTIVTDKQGRYDALLEPGTYQLEVSKPQYLFPSQIVSAQIDGDFQNVYNAGAGIQVQGDQIAIPDVPLDPINAQRQWQLATGPKKLWYAIQKVGNYMAAPILIVGAIASATVVVVSPDKPMNWIICAFYVVLLILQLRLRHKVEKAWGVVYDIATNAVLPLTTIQLIEPASSKVVTSRLSDYQGRFAFLPEPGTYVIKATKAGYQQVAEVVEAPQTDRAPLRGEVNIEKPDQRITGDIAMRQANT